MIKEFKLEDEYNDLHNVSIGDWGYVKGGVRKDNKRAECIKVILKRKCDPQILEAKRQSLTVLQSMVRSDDQNVPQINKIYQLIDADKKLYVFSELVAGCELQKEVLIGGVMSAQKGLSLAASLAKIMLLYWEKKLAYVDLRCEKIILDGSATADSVSFKLIDNGNSIPCASGSMSASEYSKFCPKDTSYLPADIHTCGFSAATQVYSIGAILYFVLTGSLPSPGKLQLADRLLDVVSAMLEADPAKRPSLQEVQTVEL